MSSAKPTTPHALPCEHCPSAHFEADEGSIEMRGFVRAGTVPLERADFPCGWRPEALCRGNWDFLRAEPQALEETLT